MLLAANLTQREFRRLEQSPCAEGSIDCDREHTDVCNVDALVCPETAPDNESFEVREVSQEGLIVTSTSDASDEQILLPIPSPEHGEIERISIRESDDDSALVIMHSALP